MDIVQINEREYKCVKCGKKEMVMVKDRYDYTLPTNWIKVSCGQDLLYKYYTYYCPECKK